MAKEEALQLEGVVVESLPNANFRVKLDVDNRVVLAYLSGKMRQHYIKVLPGDKVVIAMSPYDLSKGRITYRSR